MLREAKPLLCLPCNFCGLFAWSHWPTLSKLNHLFSKHDDFLHMSYSVMCTHIPYVLNVSILEKLCVSDCISRYVIPKLNFGVVWTNFDKW